MEAFNPKPSCLGLGAGPGIGNGLRSQPVYSTDGKES